MKKAVIIGLIIFVVGYFVYQETLSDKSTGLENKPVTNDYKVDKDITIEMNTNNREMPMDREGSTAVEDKSTDPVTLKRNADEKKKEIEQLMHEYDQYKSDKNKRAAIKEKIDKSMAEYNKMILPIAVEQVKNN